MHYLLNPILASFIGFVLGKFLLPFVLYNPPTVRAMRTSAETKSASDGMPAEFHFMRTIRDVDHAGAGAGAALAIWALSALRHEAMTAGVGLMGWLIVAMLASRTSLLNLGRARNFTIASTFYLAAWYAISLL